VRRAIGQLFGSTHVPDRRIAYPSSRWRRLIASSILWTISCASAAQQPGDQTPPVSIPDFPSATGRGQIPGDVTGSGRQEALAPDTIKVTTANGLIYTTNRIQARDVVIEFGEYTLSGELLEGDPKGELVFSGNPKLTVRGETLTGDTIRFNVRTKAYRIDNLSTALSPDFLKGRLLDPLYLSGETIFGRRNEPIFGQKIDATTCDRESPHYHLRGQEVEVVPGKRVVLRRATFYLWGHRILTLPTLVIPLDRRPRRLRLSDLPQVGRSIDEGYFAKSAFDTLVADRIPGLLRLDLMEKKGIGIGTEQEWRFLRAVGAFALYAIPTGGTNKNLSGRVEHSQDLGGGNVLTLGNEYQNNSYLALPETTNFNTRFGYTRNVEGSSTTINLSRTATDSTSTFLDALNNVVKSTSKSRSYTGTFGQTLQLGRSLSMNMNADYSRYSSSTPSGIGSARLFQITEQLSTRFQADQRESNYLLQLSANKNVPIGRQAQQSFFGGVEKLPELTLSSYRFTEGPLSELPATFTISAGKYSEGGASFGGSTAAQKVATERIVAGFDVASTRLSLGPRTDLNLSGGFQQFLYGQDGIAQYVLRNNTTLSQRWNRRSGLNLNYTYQQPQGGTPFRFDQQSKYHALNADIGFLDDRRMQLTARVGYDFGQQAFGGFTNPWQTLSINLLVRPVNWARFRSLLTFDPNTNRFVSSTADIRFRGPNDTAIDLVGRFDPQRHKFGQINGYLNIPIARVWRVVALFQYNGYLSRFESRNLQIVRDLHCMEASLTYIDNPFGFRNDKQVFFSLRIKGLPFFQRFGVGQFGQAIDTSVGEVY
jgi:hypothetical protein